MRILPSILAHAATVQATLLVGDYNTGSLMTSSFEEVTFGSPIELFGTREFSTVFVNANAGAVSFDKEFVSIDQGNCSFIYFIEEEKFLNENLFQIILIGDKSFVIFAEPVLC